MKAAALFLSLASATALPAAPVSAPIPAPAPAASPAAVAQRPPTHLTLDGAVAYAIRNATAVLKAGNQAELSATALLQGYAQFLPNLVVGSSLSENWGTTLYAINGVLNVNARTLSTNFLISTTLNLFNGLADISSLKAAMNRKNAAHLSLAWAKQQIAIDVSQLYLQTILDQENVTIAQKNLQASQARLKLLQGQAEVGTVSTADLFRQQAQTSSDELFLVNSETRLHDDQLLLIQRLTLDPARDYALDPPSLAIQATELVSEPEAPLIERALESREDLHAQDELTHAARWDIQTAEAPYFPRLDLSFTRNGAGLVVNHQLTNGVDTTPSSQLGLGAQLGNQIEYSVGLNLTWNLFDRLQTRLGVKRAEVAADNTRLDFEDLRRQVIADIRRVKKDFASASRQTQTARVGLEAAQKAYAVIEERYRVGSSSFIDLLASQNALVQAESFDAQARINLKLQELLLQYFVGDWKVPQ